jgi:hypothetical protein
VRLPGAVGAGRAWTGAASRSGLQLAALPEQEAALVGLGIALDEDVQLFRRSPKGTAPPVAPPPR